MSHAQLYRRPTAVTVLAVLNFIGGPLSLLLGVVSIFAAQSGDPETTTIFTILGFVYIGFGVLGTLTAVGLWNLKSYGRVLQIAASIIGLLGIPVGTIISAVILWYMFKPGVKVLFSEKPVAQLSTWEIAEAQRVQGGSAAVIVLAIVLPIVLIAFIGILAAIAIPSLLRARVSANEAMAIGDIRTVISAQTAYAQANGGYYDSLECLAAPQECIPGYPAEGPVFLSGPVDGVRSGYQRELFFGAPADSNDVAFANLSPSSVSSFVFVAYPATPGTTGVRSFCGDETGMICAIADGASPQPVDGRCPPSCVPLQ